MIVGIRLLRGTVQTEVKPEGAAGPFGTRVTKRRTRRCWGGKALVIGKLARGANDPKQAISSN